jgi:hypothetical protein
MKTADLIPREPRRMKQPKKDTLREQLILAAETIERQRRYMDWLRLPWPVRIFRRPPA